MLYPKREKVANHLLRAISADDFRLFGDGLEPLTVPLHNDLAIAGVPLTHVVFLESGVISVVATTPAGRQAEVGLIGREGMMGASVVNDNDVSAFSCFMQISGVGHRLPVARLRQALAASATLRAVLGRYCQSFMVQVSHSALAYAVYSLDERLARWLLMSHDRVGGTDVTMTHEFLSLMLGVRRAGVTVALQAIEKDGLIVARRGVVTIIDRAGLEARAAGSYGAPETEFQRLLGVDFRRSATGAGAGVAPGQRPVVKEARPV